jgi:hypothetical protein
VLTEHLHPPVPSIEGGRNGLICRQIWSDDWRRGAVEDRPSLYAVKATGSSSPLAGEVGAAVSSEREDWSVGRSRT